MIENQLPVQVFMHHKEWSRRSNSAHLLKLCLKKLQLNTHGAPRRSTPWPRPAEGDALCVLFPTDTAKVLTVDDRSHFTRLIVLDGNWRQAKKAANRIARISRPSFRTIPYTQPSEFKLRSQSAEHRLSTFETVARALAILEHPTYFDKMMDLFRAHVEVTLTQRSRRNFSKVVSKL